MNITVGGKVAALKKGTSFEYVAENRMFGGSDGYTLSITFPLRGCPQNIEIFGHINRADVDADRVRFDCEIRDANFYKAGCLAVTEINDSEVKAQFLDGRSELNFDTTFADIYINELELGTWPTTMPATPMAAWSGGNVAHPVALPWVSPLGEMQNVAEPSGNSFKWHDDTKGLSWQLYLYDLTTRICDAVHYTWEFQDWYDDLDLYYLLVCNTLPYAWSIRDYARALPHWTVEEYFEKLELILGGEFDIDHRESRITFTPTRRLLKSLSQVVLENIVDEHVVEVAEDESNCNYIDVKNLIYKEQDHVLWKFYSCDWFIQAFRNSDNMVRHYDTMAALLAAAKPYAASQNTFRGRDGFVNSLLHARDVDRYFVLRCVRKELVEERKDPRPNVYRYICILQPVNDFGGRIMNESDDAEQEEIEFVPVRIDDTDAVYGPAMFLHYADFSETDDSDDTASRGDSDIDPSDRPGNMGMGNGDVSGTIFDMTKEEKDAEIPKGWAEASLTAGEKESRSEYFDCIYLAWYCGGYIAPYPACPHIYPQVITPNWTLYNTGSPLRLNSGARAPLYDIDPRKKYTFKFLADSLPNPRAVFLIRNRRYICAKLTATFTEQGMSQLIKFEGYPIKD